jgi:pimeloyl-ACP methyl ester carboxylesterase
LSKVISPVIPKNIKNKTYALLGSDYNTDLSPVLKDVIKNMLSTDVTDYAKRIRIPTLLIYGDKDTSTPLWMAQELKGCIVDSQLCVIHNQDHWVHQNQAEEVAKHMESFLHA